MYPYSKQLMCMGGSVRGITCEFVNICLNGTCGLRAVRVLYEYKSGEDENDTDKELYMVEVGEFVN
jgi:hypothetical protein